MKSETEIVAELNRILEVCRVSGREPVRVDFDGGKYAYLNPDAIEAFEILRDWITSDDAAGAGKGEVKP